MVILSNNFYHSVLKKLLKEKLINLDSKLLIAAGGSQDKNAFQSLGFSNVTITNVDVRMKEDSFKPYNWNFQDVENLTYKDNEFDYCIIHHGLHHCLSPHKGLLELYRTAKCGILVFEGLDNFITKLGTKAGFSEKYELVAVNQNQLKFGGLRNSFIPIFVYRWTTNEIKKTINSYNPKNTLKIKFFYGLEIPFSRLMKLKNKILFILSLIFSPFVLIFFVFFHQQIGNRFSFFIKKSDCKVDLFPWLDNKNNEVVPNEEYFNKKFVKKTDQN